MLEERIDEWIRAHADELLATAQALVRIPSENLPPAGGERDAQQLVADRLRALGAEVDVFTPAEVPGLTEHEAYQAEFNGVPRDYRDRPNVVGVFKGSGAGRSALLSTHIDTVAARPELWTARGPFSGDIVDGRLYGRGSYDTKAALASHLLAVQCLRELGVELAGDVLIESVVDEEFGGSHGVLASRVRGYQADIAVNSEPTDLIVYPTHRGGREAYVRITGDAGMAFAGEDLFDPVRGLAKAVEALAAFNVERNRAPRPALYEDQPELPLYFNQIGGGGTTYAEAIGTPEECYLHFWAETYEGTTADEFDTAALAAIRTALGMDEQTFTEHVTLQPTTRFMPGSSMALDHPALGVLRDAFSSTPGREFTLKGATFACDAYVFNLHSTTPALVLGPGGGGAHAPDEYVNTEDLIDLARILARFLLDWCGVGSGTEGPR
jgi:acetylornithine deacetylase